MYCWGPNIKTEIWRKSVKVRTICRIFITFLSLLRHLECVWIQAQCNQPHIHTHSHPYVLRQLSLTLSTVAACVALRAGAGVLRAAASIHAPDITRLNCGRHEREKGRNEGDVVGVGVEWAQNKKERRVRTRCTLKMYIRPSNPLFYQATQAGALPQNT